MSIESAMSEFGYAVLAGIRSGKLLTVKRSARKWNCFPAVIRSWVEALGYAIDHNGRIY